MKKFILSFALLFGMFTFASATEATSITLKYSDIWGKSKISCYQMTIADDSTFTFGNGGVKAYWLTSQTDNEADGPVVDSVSAAGVFTFGCAGTPTVLLWIVHD
jgi:hypothetical protein